MVSMAHVASLCRSAHGHCDAVGGSKLFCALSSAGQPASQCNANPPHPHTHTTSSARRWPLRTPAGTMRSRCLVAPRTLKSIRGFVKALGEKFGGAVRVKNQFESEQVEREERFHSMSLAVSVL